VRTEALARAQLIDSEGQLQANYQLAQLAQSNLSFEDFRAELRTRLELARRDVAGYTAVSSRLSSLLSPAPATALTRQALELEQQFTQSDLQLARTEQALTDLHKSVSAVDATLARYDRLIEGLRASPYLKAIEGNLMVAFVPYENLDSVRPGASLYGCSLMLLWCRQVGEVTRVLDGEVSVRHPVRQQTLRGVMVELDLAENRWAQEQLLHVGRPPLFL
jgi:hypothetical protein